MLRSILQTVTIITAITLGSFSLSVSAAPTNPWGGGDDAAQVEQQAPEANQPAQVTEQAKPAEPEQPAVGQSAADADQAEPKKPDFDPKAAKIDENKVPELEKAKEGKIVVARVVWVKGTFTATESDLTTKRELKPNSVIYLNDTLETPARSTAQIIFTDNASMTFRPDTVFHIKNYKYEKEAKPDAEEKNTYVMDLVTGGFRTVTGLIAEEDPDSYAVNTPVATIGVRGTEYSIVYKEGEDLLIKQYQGKPCMKNKATEDKEVCLDNDRRYGEASSQDAEPKILAEQPSVFATDVEVVPVTFTKGTIPTDDTISGAGSFCIQ